MKKFLIPALLLAPALCWSQSLYPGRVYPSQGPCTLTTVCTFAVPVLAPSGTAAAPGLAVGDAAYGLYYSGGALRLSTAGIARAKWEGAEYNLVSDVSRITIGGSSDTVLTRDGAANTWAQKNGNADQFWRHYGANGGYCEYGVNSELVTIAAAAVTDSTGNLLPADAVIDRVVVRVVTAIPTAATFSVGDATTAARFATGVAVAGGTTAVGMLHRHPSVADAAGPVQSTAAKIRFTPNIQPATATGQVRIESFFSRCVAPST